MLRGSQSRLPAGVGRERAMTPEAASASGGSGASHASGLAIGPGFGRVYNCRRPGGPAARRPGGPAARRPGGPAARRPGGPAGPGGPTCARRLAGARKPAHSEGSPGRPDPRPGPSRARLFHLPTLALLLGALTLFAAAPAQAQHTTVWSATLTVQDPTGYTGGRGCVGNDQTASQRCDFALDDDNFTYGSPSVTYHVNQVEIGDDQAAGLARLGLDKAWPSELKIGTLHVGSTELALSSAQFHTWSNPFRYLASLGGGFRPRSGRWQHAGAQVDAADRPPTRPRIW